MTNELLEKANFLANQGRLEEAIEVYKEVLEKDPENLDVRGYIIALSLKSGHWSEVVEQHMECGDIFNRQEKWDAAVDRYREVLRLEETVEAHGSSLRSYDEIVRVKAATKRVKPEVCLQIGLYYLWQEELDQAVQYLRKSIELRLGCWQAHLALGEAYLGLGMDVEATRELQEVIRLASDEAGPAYEMLGEISARKGSRAARNPADWFRQASDSYLKKQQSEAAIQALLRGAELEPDDPDLFYSLSDLYESQGREYKARGDDAALSRRRKRAMSSALSQPASEAPIEDLNSTAKPEGRAMKTRVDEFLETRSGLKIDWIKATLEEDGFLWTQGGYRLVYIQYALKLQENPLEYVVGGIAEIGGVTDFIPERERRRKPTQVEVVLKQVSSWTEETRKAVLEELLKGESDVA